MTKSPPPAIAELDAQRLDSIDCFRGFAIVGMVLVDFVSRIRAVPAWLKHAPEGTRLAFAGIIAPMFIFAIGLTFSRSMERRIAENGEREAYLHFLRRGLAILGFGVFFTFPGHYWGLFQFIGAAVLLTACGQCGGAVCVPRAPGTLRRRRVRSSAPDEDRHAHGNPDAYRARTERDAVPHPRRSRNSGLPLCSSACTTAYPVGS